MRFSVPKLAASNQPWKKQPHFKAEQYQSKDEIQLFDIFGTPSWKENKEGLSTFFLEV